MVKGALVKVFGAGVVAALFLAACGGSSELVPGRRNVVQTGASPSANSTGLGGGPTPVAPASPISVPTARASSTPVGGLPSASPVAGASSTP